MRRALALAGAGLVLAACPSPRRPGPPPGAADVTLAIGRPGASLRGVAGDAGMTFAALTSGTGDAQQTVIEARRGAAVAWRAELAGSGGALARTGTLVVAAIGATGASSGVELRGQPGARVAAYEAATGAAAWRVALDSNEWSVITALAADAGGVVVGGAFSGTLRAADKVVSSGGRTDGFVARLGPGGEVRWLVRVGGPHADAVQGVAVAGDRIAIAGTFAPGADVLGAPLAPYDPKTPYADAFVAELDGAGARRWSASFGGKKDDSVAGVAIDGKGRVVVAANAREMMNVAGAQVFAHGDADGLVAWWERDGTAGGAIALGGADFDGLRAIAATGNHVVVGGFYSGSIKLGDEALTAGGGDDAFLAELDAGALVATWPVVGAGREEIVAVAPVPGGFVAGVAYTAAARVGGAELPAPPDPLSGAALVIRAAR